MNGVRKQVFVNAMGLLLLFVSGTAYSFLAPVTAKLSEEHKGLIFNGGWLVAALDLGCFCTALLAVLLADRYGRKSVINGSLVFYIIGWSLFLTEPSARTLTIARFLHGFANGGALVVLPTYMIEITEPSLGQFLPGSFQLAMYAGVMHPFILGPYLPWKYYCCTCFPLPFLLCCAFTQCPESPYYLMGQKRENEARRVLKSLRNSPDVEYELETIRIYLQGDQRYKVFVESLFSDKVEKRCFRIVQIAKAAMPLSGMPVILNYSLELLSKSQPYNAYVASNVLVWVLVLLSILVFFLPDDLDLYLLMIVSCLICCITNMIVGQYLYLKYNLKTISYLGVEYLYVPLFLYAICAVIGMGFYSELLQAKMYGVMTRGLGRGIVVTVSAALSFSMLFIYTGIGEHYGTCANFWMYSVLCLIVGLVSTKLYFRF